MKVITLFSENTETSRESNEWIYHVNIRSLGKNFDNLELYLKTFGKNKPSFVCLS